MGMELVCDWQNGLEPLNPAAEQFVRLYFVRLYLTPDSA
jgi:hypothetical protein